MVKAMCENEAFTDITDIYACIVNLVEHSYGYDSTEILLTDTQVVHLMASLEEGDYDTDQDNLLDRQELDHEENVNISNLLEEYINYNRLPEEEANKLRADPYIKMWAYKSNPALPDTDFDGRNDDFDIHRPLENRQVGKMSTLNYDSVNFDYNQDYRYFFMPSTQYYYDLSEMSMILANMVNKKSGINRRWLKDTNYINRIANDSGGIDIEEYRERYNAYSIEDYMNYIGLEDIEVRDMSSTYEDSNVCRYAIGHRDVVYSLGRTQNVVRNVIAISIGDIESKAAELYANFDGHSGREGDYTEYHHVGFDIVANRILETLERYASRYDPRYQKVYWITGEGGGGSVANLLAQKMIKKLKTNKNIYCYTFQALNTINCNNIPAVQRISNEPYGSIFNLYNDDNQTLQIYTNQNLFFKYGVNKHVSVTSSSTYKSIWRNCYNDEHGGYINYPTGNDTILPDYIQYFKDLSKNLSERVFGFEMTEQDFFNMVFNHPDSYPDEKDDVEAFFQSMQNEDTDAEYIEKWHLAEYNLQNKQEHILALINNIRAKLGMPLVRAAKDSAGLVKLLETVKTDPKAPSYGSNTAREIMHEKDPRDGVTFEDSYDMWQISKEKIAFDYQKDKVSESDWCIKIGSFKFSNYTMPISEYTPYDISYSQFWHQYSEDLGRKYPNYMMIPWSHYYLYQNGAGDYTRDADTLLRKTNMIYGRYHTNSEREIFVNTNKDTDSIVLYDDGTYKCEVVMLDGRILTAAPLHLLLKTDESVIKDLYINEMHRYVNYATDSNGHRVFRNNTWVDRVASGNKAYKYMDVVVESFEGYQYVIPFMVVDVKWLHNEEGGHYSYITDNTYGHVYETIDSEGNRTYDHMNPIEPYLRFTKNDTEYNGNDIPDNVSSQINNKLTEFIFGSEDTKDKIVSMRLYNKKYDATNDATKTWWHRIRDGMAEMTEEEYKNNYRSKIHKGVIVKYK